MDRQPNAEARQKDPHSLLNLYRALIGLRRRTPQLLQGQQIPVRAQNDILMFKRADDQGQVLVACNMADQPRRLAAPFQGKLLFSTHLIGIGETVESPLMLRANEGILALLDTRA